IEACGEAYDSDDIEVIGKALLGDEDNDLVGAVDFYRDNLADETEDEITDEDGETVTVKNYMIKETVKDVLSDEQYRTLSACAELMEHYHAAYVDLLIEAAASLSGDELAAAVEEARAAYEYLSGTAGEYVKNLELLEALEEQLESETETESETVAESETGTESETATESESDTENESGTENETDTENETGTESETDTEMESDTGSEDNTANETESDAGTESESESEGETSSGSDDISVSGRINSFLMMADGIFSETASPEGADYQNAIAFYQMYLAAASAEIVGETVYMEGYDLSDETLAYLSGLEDGGEALAEELRSTYQSLCLAYVKYMVQSLDAETMTREELAAAQEVYDQLGITWSALLEEESPSVSDYLTAYDIALQIQELDEESEDFLTDLESLYLKYLSLSTTQMGLVWNADLLISYLDMYGLLEAESEYESEYDFDWDDDYSDYGYDDGTSLTAAELKEQIEEKETSIKTEELNIREKELKVAALQREVDKKVVTSTLDGTVVSIGDESGDSEDEYFVKVTSSVGLYAKGAISELALESVNIGDTISGVTDYGDTFTAVIKEISEYPDTSDEYYYYSGNTNASYYPFYALIDDPEGIDEGGAEITLSTAYADVDNTIYLSEEYFVRTDNTGNNYVYVQGEDGTLEKRYVTLSSVKLYGYYIGVTSGLSLDDLIAFPYGDDVYEGAATTEVDQLSYE
ncbi:MAG: MSCRAMM family adhesin SdrC, partial [Lachnospiraceae bacterium]|nr:MSCRAMM family adhesin SdrC [Lachnospiraceae bacterium]